MNSISQNYSLCKRESLVPYINKLQGSFQCLFYLPTLKIDGYICTNLKLENVCIIMSLGQICSHIKQFVMQRTGDLECNSKLHSKCCVVFKINCGEWL